MKRAVHTPPLLEMCDISKTFPGVRALDRVAFDLYAGEVHALVGENGAGKSTLMKVLAAVYPSGTYEGEIKVDGAARHFAGIRDAEKAGIAVVHQELSLVSDMTIGENIFLGREPRRLGPHSMGSALQQCPEDSRRAAAQPSPRHRGEPARHRAAAPRRDREGALARRAHPDPRRADRRAHR